MYRYTLRGIGPPLQRQREILDHLWKPSLDIKEVVLQCGRRYGKTSLSIDIACRLLAQPKGTTTTLYLQPDNTRLSMVFWINWRAMVPPECYRIKRLEGSGRRYIQWKATGNCLYPFIRNVHGNTEDVADNYRGIEFTHIMDDESAIKFNLSQYKNTLMCLTGDSPIRFYLSLTTPKAGQFSQLLDRPGIKIFYGYTGDNLYLMKRHPNFIENTSSGMTRLEIRRELYGEMVALQGQVFGEVKIDAPNAKEPASENRWPLGNVHWDFNTFRPELPWWLFCDLGSATGAFIAVQKIPAMRFGGDVWVAVADFCTNHDASASRAFQKMNQEFGRPAAVVAGADVHTKNSVSGVTVAYFASQVWGNVPIRAMGESLGDKMRQHDIASYMINSSQDHRRFCVAKNFRSLDPDSHRGLREMLLGYTMRPIEERSDDEFLPKGSDQPLCHVADAFLMGAELMAPPSYLKKQELMK